jgi:WD40 repeat protein
MPTTASSLSRPVSGRLPYPIARYAQHLYQTWDAPQTNAVLLGVVTLDTFELTLRYLNFVLLADTWPRGLLSSEQQRTILGVLYQPVLGTTLESLRLLCNARSQVPDGVGYRLASRITARSPNLLGQCQRCVALRNRLKGHGFVSAPDRPADDARPEIEHTLATISELLNALAELSDWPLVRMVDQDRVEDWMGPEPPTATRGARVEAGLLGRYMMLGPGDQALLNMHPLLVGSPEGDPGSRLRLYEELSVHPKKHHLRVTLRAYDTGITCEAPDDVREALEHFLGLGPLAQVFHRHRYAKELLEIEAIQKAEVLLERYHRIVGALRHDLAEEIAAFVQEQESGIVVIQGQPGMGKTSLMAYLIRQRFLEFKNPPPAYFFFRRLEGMTSQMLCHRTLYEQLYRFHSSGSDPLKDLGEDTDATTDIYVKLSNLLHTISARGLLAGRKQLVLIDALDEADRPAGESDMAIFRRLPTRLAPGVFLIVSTRPVSDVEWFASLQDIKRIDLNDPAHATGHQQDGVDYIGQRLAGLALPRDVCERLSRFAAGNFLFLSVVCDWVTASGRSMAELVTLLNRLESQERGDLLSAVYAEFWSRMEERLDPEARSAVRKVAGLLAAALAPINRDFLHAVLGPGSERWNAALDELQEYLVTHEEERYPEPRQEGDLPVRETFFRLFHKSFADHVKSSIFAAEEGHGLLGQFGRAWETHPNGFCRYYALRYGPAHLNRAGQVSELLALVADTGFLMAKAELGMAHELCQDLSRALEAAPAGTAQRDQVGLLLEALLADVYFLQRHPTALGQCLHARGWWYDSPEAAAHYRPGSRERPWERPLLSPVVEQFPARQAWVRPLRPPPVHLRGPQRMVLPGHADGIEAIAVFCTPDTAIAASAGGNADRDTAVRLWDLDLGRLLKTFRGHERLVHRVRFSPDGRRLLTSSADRTLRVWDVGDRQPPVVLQGHHGNIDCVAFGPEGRWAISGARDGTVRLWPLEPRGEPVVICAGSGQARGVAVHPNGRVLAAGFTDGRICLWDLEASSDTYRAVLCAEIAAHQDVIYSVAFSPDGNYLASGSRDRAVLLWDWQGGELVVPLEGHGHWVYTVAFSPDGKQLATASRDETVRVWRVDPESMGFGEEEFRFRGHKGAVYSVGFRPRPQGEPEVVSGGADGTVRVWSLNTAGQRQLDDHEATIRCLDFTPDGSRVVTGAGHVYYPQHHSVRVWDAATGLPVNGELRGHTDAVLAVAGSPLASRVVSGSRDRTLRVWQPGHTAALWVVPHPAPVQAVAITPDESLIASGCMDGRVRVWRLTPEGPVAMHEFTGHSRLVSAVALHPQGTHLVSGGFDGMVWLWDLAAGAGRQLGAKLGLVREVAFSADGQLAGSVSQDFVPTQTSGSRERDAARPRIHRWPVAEGRARPPIPNAADLVGVLGSFSVLARVDHEAAEMVFTRRMDRQPEAWFPAAPELLATHPQGEVWAGANGNHLFLLELRRS